MGKYRLLEEIRFIAEGLQGKTVIGEFLPKFRKLVAFKRQQERLKERKY